MEMGKLQALASVFALLTAAAMSVGGAGAAPIQGIQGRPQALLGEHLDVPVYCRGYHCDDDDGYSYRRYYSEPRSYARPDYCRGYDCAYDDGYAPSRYYAPPPARFFGRPDYGYYPTRDYDWDTWPSPTCGKYRYRDGDRCADARYYPPYEENR
jgi:hypothetical protein